ncbi:helix-hairpin-helix domain-containing protein [Merismopedia glauca]|uniref:DNA uptake protein n=1 Tax=Merismopedia glauca CCAP 1448/3 TaxID=1296344 RepID=A0A2T1C2S2_9CYAN|nr:ComEA family DNA-binding protein [Merismopedia glauca]PSB02575.1 DNA uptake protein [Merismopedia glauca CCAP 1448/3]
MFGQHLIRQKLLKDPYYRLQSAAEVALAAELGVYIDANQATIDDWLRLPGISIHQARSLVQLSQSGVKFYSIEDVAAALSLPVQRLLPVAAIVKFFYYHELPSASKINLNTASFEELIAVPVINISLATVIIENRKIAGKYRNLADFQQRLSLSGEAVAQLMYYLLF